MPSEPFTMLSVMRGRIGGDDYPNLHVVNDLVPHNNLQVVRAEWMIRIITSVEVLTIRIRRVEMYSFRIGEHSDDRIKPVQHVGVVSDDLVVPSILVQNHLATPSVRTPQNFSRAQLASIVRLNQRSVRSV